MPHGSAASTCTDAFTARSAPMPRKFPVGRIPKVTYNTHTPPHRSPLQRTVATALRALDEPVSNSVPKSEGIQHILCPMPHTQPTNNTTRLRWGKNGPRDGNTPQSVRAKMKAWPWVSCQDMYSTLSENLRDNTTTCMIHSQRLTATCVAVTRTTGSNARFGCDQCRTCGQRRCRCWRAGLGRDR